MRGRPAPVLYDDELQSFLTPPVVSDESDDSDVIPGSGQNSVTPLPPSPATTRAADRAAPADTAVRSCGRLNA
ncbi:hypothetical protein HaLaN_01186 [Haematococcus lacustris]|uniref:Uncharacterized protein n=1 Tax=Haematococcus lacustris TaxID=44745 RepID=A0A699YKK3_HAELA|nr:hypothetical protein HaLaN_01186 [Haematococcus lacustris]